MHNYLIAIALVVLATTCIAVDNEFTMQMTGHCSNDGAYCRAKANSQQLTVTINADSAVDFEKKSLIGSCEFT